MDQWCDVQRSLVHAPASPISGALVAEIVIRSSAGLGSFQEIEAATRAAWRPAVARKKARTLPHEGPHSSRPNLSSWRSVMLNVLVTGGSRGLGLGIARALAFSGFQVISIARKEGEELPPIRAQIALGASGALHFRAFDLADVEGIPSLVTSLSREFGRFYGLVNNAALGTAGILANIPNNTIEQLVRLNVTSPLTLTKYLVRSMMTGQGGRIVNISSVVGTTGYRGLSVYSATKASMVGFTRSLARELGPLGVTVNAVAPGFVDTKMTHELTPKQRTQIVGRSALQRLPETADVANTVDFLFSDKASNITGTVITVDAGNTA
jgi:3-oxoacyl-[acyl-carrier protein] reductase